MTSIIDTDSFQVRDLQSNKVYRCTVGSEGFTPPELLDKDFETTQYRSVKPPSPQIWRSKIR